MGNGELGNGIIQFLAMTYENGQANCHTCQILGFNPQVYLNIGAQVCSVFVHTILNRKSANFGANFSRHKAD